MMKAISLILFVLFIQGTMSPATTGSIYSGVDFISLFDIYSDTVAYMNNATFIYKTGSLDTKKVNITDLECSTTKGICIVATDFVYYSIKVDPNGTNNTLKEIYSVRPQTVYRIHSKIAFITGSDYFLTASLSKYGVNRWKVGNNATYTQLVLKNMPVSLEIADILVVGNTNFALIAFMGYHSINLIDFVTMVETRAIQSSAGLMALLSADMSQANFVCSSERNITKLNYLDGTVVASTVIDYMVTGMKNINFSDFVIISTWEQIYVYSFSGSDRVVWLGSIYYYYSTGKQMPGGIKWNAAQATMYFSGLGHITSLADTTATFCHPTCNDCSMMLSEYKCNSCKSPATSENNVCKTPANIIKPPPGGLATYLSAKWSDDNIKPAPAKGFNIKDYYLYFIIGGGALVAICCVFCICKMCCKSEDEQQVRNPNQVRNTNQVSQKQNY